MPVPAIPPSAPFSAPSYKLVAASGSAQALVFGPSREVFYDLTLTAACTLTAGIGLPGQSIIVVLRGAYAYTMPLNCYYPNNVPPTPQCSAALVDILQFTVLTNGSLLCTPIVMGGGLPSLSLSAVSGILYANNSYTLAGTYLGPAPTNIDYQLDAGTWVTLGNGVASITNGVFSFPLTMPAVGTHALAVRATNFPAEVSSSLSLTSAAPTAPGVPTVTPSVGSGSVMLGLSAPRNGSDVTSFLIYEGASAGGEGTSAYATVASAAITNSSGIANATFSDTGLPNGTARYYTAVAVNSVGSSAASTEISAIPVALVATPTHYLAGDASHNSYMNSPTTAQKNAQNVSDGYLDIAVWVALSNYAAINFLTERWANTGNTSSNSSFAFYLDASGKLNCPVFGSNGYVGITSTVALTSVVTPDANVGLWLRAQINAGSASVTPASGPVSSIPSGAAVFSYGLPTSASVDSVTWSQLGTSLTGLGAFGISNQTSQNLVIGSISSTNPGTGKFFKSIARNSGKTILWNPDYTALSTGATSYTDTAATPLPYGSQAGAII